MSGNGSRQRAWRWSCVEGTQRVPRVRRAGALPQGARELACLSLLTIALLLPFVGKPLHVDDPMYVWTAKYIVEHPLDFYGLTVNWIGKLEPMAVANKNPPGVSYWLALVGAFLGWSEPALHAGMLVPAVLLVVGVWLLARRLGGPPILAGLCLLAMPGFLVSSTTLMADVLATALWTWALLAWVVGVQEERTGWLLAGSLLAGLCILTKYVGLALIPLLLVYSWVKRQRSGVGTLLLLLPFAIALAYRAQMISHYAVDPFSVGSFVREAREFSKASAFEYPWIGLSFLGGACLPSLLLAGWIFGRRTLVLAGLSILLVAAALISLRTLGGYPLVSELGVRRGLVAHLACFIVSGGLIVLLIFRHVVRQRTAEAILLALWICGLFVFASILNWTTNVRALLPVAPAVAILLATEAWQGDGSALFGSQRGLLAMLGISTLAGLLVAQGDQAFARSARDAALEIAREDVGIGRRPLWFQGAWGFQYYMEREGARKIDWQRGGVLPGERIVQPDFNTNLMFLPFSARLLTEHRTAVHAVAQTLSWKAGAGFYTDLSGPAPYVFGFPADQVYSVFEAETRYPP